MSSLWAIELYIYVNPLTPKSDQNLISPYNITPDSGIKVFSLYFAPLRKWSPTEGALDC